MSLLERRSGKLLAGDSAISDNAHRKTREWTLKGIPVGNAHFDIGTRLHVHSNALIGR